MALINALTTIADVKTLAGISDTSQDARLELLINATSMFINNYCQRTFKRTTYTNEEYSPSNRQLLILRNYPIVSVTTLTVDDTLQVQGTDYIVTPEYSKSGMLYRAYGWTGRTIDREYLTLDPVAMKRTVKVTYIAGYYLPADVGYVQGADTALPADLSYACNLMVLSAYIQARKNNFDGLTSMSENGLSYAWGNLENAKNNQSGLSSNVAGILNKYKKQVVTA
jgi:hypothetical protein